MQRLLSVIIFLIVANYPQAQDTIVLNGQPQWNRSLPIADSCLFFEETTDKPLSFEEAKQQTYIPFNRATANRPTKRPLIIQWYKFIVLNASATDTIRLQVGPSPTYFSRLYDDKKLIGKGGIYETSSSMYDESFLPVIVPPNATKTYWLRYEDREGHIYAGWVSLQTRSTLLSELALGQHKDRLLFLLLGILAGCMAFMTIFASYQYYLYRDKAFPWYIAYTAFSTLTILFWIDIRHQFGMFNALFHDIMFAIFLFFVPVLYTVFIGKMLQLSQQFKKAWIAVKILMAIAVVQMLIEFTTFRTGRFLFNDHFQYFISMIPVAVLNIILLVLTALIKDRVKWFMFGGLLCMLILWCLPIMGIINTSLDGESPLAMVLIFIPFFSGLGVTIESIFFSFALSYRSKLVLVEKNNMQSFYAKQLQEELDKKTKALEAELSVKEEQKLKQVSEEFEQKIAATELSALRAQMNPHFIFNCLNSIKLYTLENDSQTASEYLTKFSQLIRLVLENSRSEKVTLQKELEALRLYIELEAMRFKDKVKYQINVNPSIDQEYTEISPLLLQPYVENAIWHGLMHKEKGGIIHINVTQPLEHLLNVEITDDGIGREAAAAYKSKSAAKQKSFGLKMTSERINIINQFHNIKTNVEVTDLKDDHSNALGTKVIVTIPV